MRIEYLDISGDLTDVKSESSELEVDRAILM